MIKTAKLLVYSFRLLPDYWYWFKYDLTQSSLISNETSTLAALTVTSHVLEKGITMPGRRLGFGCDRVRNIIKHCRYAIIHYTANHIEIQSTLNGLDEYLKVHRESNYTLPEDIEHDIRELLKYKQRNTVVCFESTPADLFCETKDFFDFAHSRHTVRWYKDETIEHDTIIKAIALAQTAPSACNRQSTKVYIIETRDKKEAVLGVHNGHSGFGDMADKILLVTSDMKYWSYKTRTSAYLDAGIFTQNLLYSLHYYHIGACTMNAHLSIKQRKKLLAIVGYSQSEIPVVFIAIGKVPEHFMVAASQRLKTE